MEYILIGKIVNTHGIKGELKVEVYTDFLEDRFKKNSTIYLGENYFAFKVKNYRMHKNNLLLTLIDNEDINLIEKYKGFNIYKSKEDIEELDNGEYYFRDIKGLDVYINDNKIGRVIDMQEGLRSNYMRILKDEDNKEYLVPFMKEYVLNVDLKNNRIDIIDLKGLL